MNQVVKEKQAISIFENEKGSVSICQNDPMGEDGIVVVEIEDVEAVVRALREAIDDTDKAK